MIRLPLVLLFSGLSARMRDLARRIGRNWFFTVAIYGILFVVLTSLIDLPFGWFEGYVRQPRRSRLGERAVSLPRPLPPTRGEPPGVGDAG